MTFQGQEVGSEEILRRSGADGLFEIYRTVGEAEYSFEPARFEDSLEVPDFDSIQLEREEKS